MGAAACAAYGKLNYPVVRGLCVLNAKTQRWCVGCLLRFDFSARLRCLAGRKLSQKWVLSLGLTPIEFLLLSQVIFLFSAGH